jgi:hypothetical protein
MNKKFEYNKDYKGPVKKIDCMNVINTGEYNNDLEKCIRKPFTARPGNKPAVSNENYKIEITEGRTKSGGYVAYPKKRIGNK